MLNGSTSTDERARTADGICFVISTRTEWPLIALATLIIGFFALRHGSNRNLVGGLLVGFLVAGAWSTTSVLGSDDFDPMAPMSFSFVVPVGEAITYLQLASGLEPSFNVTLVLGVLLGSFVSSVVRGEFRLQSYESASDRTVFLAVLMGVGGIFALGCNTGQAITGLPPDRCGLSCNNCGVHEWLCDASPNQQVIVKGSM